MTEEEARERRERRERRAAQADAEWVRSWRRFTDVIAAVTLIVIFGFMMYGFLLGDL